MNSTDVAAYIDLDTFPSSGDEEDGGLPIVAEQKQPIASTSYLPMEHDEGSTTMTPFNEGTIDSTPDLETSSVGSDLPALLSAFRKSAPDAASLTMMLGGDDTDGSDGMGGMMAVDANVSAPNPEGESTRNGLDRLSPEVVVSSDDEAEVEQEDADEDEDKDEELVQSVDPLTLAGSSTLPVEMETDVASINPALIAESLVTPTSTLASVARSAPATVVKKNKSETTTTTTMKTAASIPTTSFSTTSKPKSAIAQGKAPATSSTTAKPAKSAASKSKSPSAAASSFDASSAANGSTAVALTENQVWIKMYDSQLCDILAHLHTTKTPLVLASRLAKGLSHFSFGDGSPQVSPWGDQSVIPPSDRLAILTQMLQNGTKEFWRAFAAAPGDEGIKTIKVWLWGASLSCASAAKKGEDRPEVDPSKGKGKELEGTLVPILKVSLWIQTSCVRIAKEAHGRSSRPSFAISTLQCTGLARTADFGLRFNMRREQGHALKLTSTLLMFPIPILLTIMTVQALDKLPLTINHLKTYELGKRVRRVDRGSKNKEAVKLARELVNKWQELASSIADSKDEASSKKAASAPTKRKTPDSSSDAAVKKLKTVTSGKVAGAETKKPITGTAAAATTKKAAPTAATAVPIKKAPVVANPLQKMLAQMKFDKKRTSEPAPSSTTASTSLTFAGTSAVTIPSADKTTELRSTLNPLKLKNKKTVHWPLNDVDLKHIRIIENCFDGQRQRKGLGDAEGDGAEYEEGGFDSLVRDMNEREGAVMTQGAVMEEEVVWYEPLSRFYDCAVIDVPDTADFTSYHTIFESEEAVRQAQREMGRPEYLFDESNPEAQMESPAEPQLDVSADEDDTETKEMTLSSEMTSDPFVMQAIANAQALNTPTQGYLQEDQLQSLLGNLVSMQEQHHHQQQQQQHLHHAHAGPSTGLEQTGVFDEQALAKLRAFDPAVIQSIVNQHPQELGMLANELSQRATFPVQLEPPPSLPHSMLAWQQQQSLVPPTPQLTISDQYNGYVPPAASSIDSQASKMKGKKGGKGAKGKVTKCRFFNTPRGCDMGTKCRFKHEF
ncbi:BQ2448_3335 [Microbotryum intermedium]|uniref:BQ2448_3335 protein n=1 Tax=Microbotryum intermedium TaxID=269621 RepID=A0A238FF00_9BASI|nr:BQ2448_3335 [Microbotryum intermedium]